ncbi:MAG: glycosyltransferase family 4 protein [Patescibacteria group bacterium]
MKNIGIIVSTFPPYAGGMGNVAAAQAKALSERGFAVTVYVPMAPGFTTDVTADFSPAVSVVPVPATIRFGNAAWVPNIQTYVANEDIVLLHYPFFGVAHAFAKGLPAGKKLVTYYHMDTVASGWRRLVFNWYHRCLPGLLQHSTAVLVSSRDYAEHSRIASFLPSLKDRLRVIPLSVDASRFIPTAKPADLLERYQVLPETPVALFVGGLDSAHYFKGVPKLLHAWQRVVHDLPVARLLIIGEGDRRKSYEHQAKKLGIFKSVSFLGAVSPSELPSHFSVADVIVSPSVDRSEAFGLVLLEAMASGRATIASDLPGVRSVVVDGETGHLVPPNDDGALATALLDLLSREAVCQRYGERGRERVVANYSEKVVGDALAELLQLIA